MTAGVWAREQFLLGQLRRGRVSRESQILGGARGKCPLKHRQGQDWEGVREVLGSWGGCRVHRGQVSPGGQVPWNLGLLGVTDVNHHEGHDGIRFGVSRHAVVVCLSPEGWKQESGRWHFVKNPRALGSCFTAAHSHGRPGEVPCVWEDLELHRY